MKSTRRSRRKEKRRREAAREAKRVERWLERQLAKEERATVAVMAASEAASEVEVERVVYDELPDEPRKPARGERPSTLRSLSRDMDGMIEVAWRADWRVERGGTDHIKLYPPDGSRIISVPQTPSKRRSVLRIRGALRRAGLELL